MATYELIKILLLGALHHHEDTARSVEDRVEQFVVNKLLVHEQSETKLDNIADLLKTLVFMHLSGMDPHII